MGLAAKNGVHGLEDGREHGAVKFWWSGGHRSVVIHHRASVIRHRAGRGRCLADSGSIGEE
jgi:hypothetical protein